MCEIIINGGKSLEGEINIGGSKNGTLPIMCAALLVQGKTVIKNCPAIEDTFTMMDILKSLGCAINFENNVLEIDAKTVEPLNIDIDSCKKMRASIILMGALLGRCGMAFLSYPGGCVIGKRPIDIHLKAFEQLGVIFEDREDVFYARNTFLKGGIIKLPFPSVGATENLIIASVLSQETTIIKNAAKEPEIIELIRFLNSAGARIKGAGSGTLVIIGVKKLETLEFEVVFDRIVAGTYMCAGAISNGNIFLKTRNGSQLEAVSERLMAAGCNVRHYNDGIYLKGPKRLKSIKRLVTGVYPKFPTDMQSQFVACLSVAKGKSVVCDKIFEARYNIVSELEKMGANIKETSKGLIIKGVEELKSGELYAKDLRGGASLVLAALCANGTTVVKNCEYINRGYEDICRDLRTLGADVRWSKERERKTV